MNLFAAFFLTFLNSFLIASIFKCWLLIFVLFFTFVIFNINFLSFFGLINASCILILTLLEFLLVVFIFKKTNSNFLKMNIKPFFSDIKNLFKTDKTFIFLAFGFIFFLLSSFLLACFYPPTEGDAVSYHALRPLFWVGEGRIFNFDIQDVRCHIMPFNSEIFYTWLFALTKNDNGYALLQFFSFFLYGASIFKIMEFFDIEFKKRVWVIFIVSSLPLIICEISSLQTDILVASLAAFAIYMIYKFKESDKTYLLYFSSLSFALMLGVKTTGFLIFLPIFVWLCFVLKKEIFKFLIFFIFNFLIFSGSCYVSNFINYGNFFGNYAAFSENAFWGGISAYFANIIRHFFLLFDFSGFKFLYFLQEKVINFEASFLTFLGIDSKLGVNIQRINYPVILSEQISGFGIIGMFVFIPCFIKSFFDKKLRIFSVFFLLFILILSFSVSYMMYNIRFILTAIMLSAPIFALSFSGKTKWLISFVVFISFVYFPFNINERKFYFKEFFQAKSLTIFQNNLRDKIYYFNSKTSPELELKNNVSPICKNSNKIGLIQAKGVEIYNTKYLEYENNCKIDVYTLLHFEKVNLSKYNYFIIPSDFLNSTDTINLSDIKKPVKEGGLTCIYAIKNKKYYNFLQNSAKNADIAMCKISTEYFLENNFSYLKQFEIKLHENGELAKFIILEKK